MPLVKAQCPNCGSALEVDNSKDAAICSYCGTPFIVEKAINNYNINNTYYVENATFNNQESENSFVKRGVTFIDLKEAQKAYDVFSEFSNKYPANYKSWLGLCISEYLLNGTIFDKTKNNAIRTAPDDIKEKIGSFHVSSQYDIDQLHKDHEEYKRQADGVIKEKEQEIQRVKEDGAHQKSVGIALFVISGVISFFVILALFFQAWGWTFLLAPVFVMVLVGLRKMDLSKEAGKRITLLEGEVINQKQVVVNKFHNTEEEVNTIKKYPTIDYYIEILSDKS